MRLVYGQANEITYWWLDGYLDFDDAQSVRARETLNQYFAWHRRSQLPDYAELLRTVANGVGEDTTGTRSCEWFAQVRRRADVAVEQALPEAAALLASLGPEQLRALERKHAKNNAEFKDDFLQRDPAKRQARSVERAIERSEQLYGRLNEAQRKLVEQRVAASPFDPERWNQERLRRQRELVATVTRAQQPQASREAIAGELRDLWRHALRSPDADYARYQQALETYNCEFFAEIHNQTTPEQRAEAQRRLRGWESDFRRLAGAG